MILITEKDAVRMDKFKSELADFPIYVLPVKHCFLFNQGDEFNQLIEKYIYVYSFEKKKN
jgi:tetraacyldisaccharide 4'-kinase